MSWKDEHQNKNILLINKTPTITKEERYLLNKNMKCQKDQLNDRLKKYNRFINNSNNKIKSQNEIEISNFKNSNQEYIHKDVENN